MTDIKQYEPLWGSWYIDEQLGEGSYGKVFKVHKEEFGKIYDAAVKIISIPQNESDIIQAKSEGLNEESARSYFQAFVTDIIQEVDLMNSFRGNSNIVSLEDHKVIEKHGEIGWDIIIRMELLENLSSYITRKPMTQAEIIKLGIDICQALEICAKHSTIHRDIKPDNIFVSQYGDYKLGDFGIARQVERTMSGLSKKGTYQYMAPEVFKGSEYGSSVDIYSLGIVMYRFLNKNRAPFLPEYPNPITPRDREEALQRRMSGEELPNINGIDEKLNAIVLKACAYDREKRFKSASDMKNALQSISQNIPGLNLPIIELSDMDGGNITREDSGEFSDYNNTDEKTQIILSNKVIQSQTEPAQDEINIKVSENIIKKLSSMSYIFYGILIALTFLSRNLSDILTFLPLYFICTAEIYSKFENNIINYSCLVYIACYLLLSVLINFRLFDYSFLILELCLLPLIASREKISRIIFCVSMIIFALVLGLLVTHINKQTHYIYVAGSAAIPFLTLLISPSALLLAKQNKLLNLGLALLIAMQVFNLITLIIYCTGLTSNNNLLYHIINANFPGLSSERFSWWIYGRFVGIIIQFLAFTPLFILAMTTITPQQFLHMTRNENRNSILILSAIIIMIISCVLVLI